VATLGRDVTEPIPTALGNPINNQTYAGTGVAYDVSIGGQPFFLLADDNNPYRRVTAQYRKQQIDMTREPGEQTLTGWWLRSQSSFHLGQGIKFFEPAQDESFRFQYTYSKGCDVWTKGQVTLLKDVTTSHYTTEALHPNGRPWQFSRSIQWTTSGTTYNGVLLLDGYDIDKIDSNGNEIHFQTYTSGTSSKIYAMCDDGVYAYWVTNNVTSGKLEVLKKLLSADESTSPTSMFTSPSITVTNAVMEYTKERIVMCVNDKVYEFAVTATSLPTAVYSHGDPDHIFTAITSSGAAIYISGYSGIQSNIYKFTLSTAGAMPTLTSAITAAELPTGEVVYNIGYYLGYMVIGTNLGARIAAVSDTDGSIAYGPLLFESEQPVYDFDFYDKFIYCTTNVDGNPGITRINLGQPIAPLVFAYAWDIYDPNTTGKLTTSTAFLGETNRLLFTTNGVTVGTSVTYKQLTSNVATLTTSTAHGLVAGDKVWVEGVDATFNSGGAYTVTATPTSTTFSYAKTAANVSLTAVSPAGLVNKIGSIYLEEANKLVADSILRTGYVRYNTVENKIFKYIVPKFDTTFGGLTVLSVDELGNEFSLGVYSQGSEVGQVGISYPQGAQQYMGFEFKMTRSAVDNTKGPTLTGYQLKVLPAVPRQRLIQYPCSLFDSESDKFGNKAGYEGAAYDRLKALEAIESNGDTIVIQDFRPSTQETYTGIIEEIDFINKTPTDKRYSGFGGLMLVTIRTIS
jgi:hypothetical protein